MNRLTRHDAMDVPNRRSFLFLQGPPGPFFRILGEELAARGHGVHRINLSGGDRYDWREGATDYRGLMRNWPLFVDAFLRDRTITDLVLFGDCRPVHRRAMGLARLRGVRIHVFEEGYIRPNWMTLERDGVNGHSPFVRDRDVIRAAAQDLPDVPELPPITASFGRRARDSYWHYHNVVTGRLLLRFPFYGSHRPGSICAEGIGWVVRYARRKRRAREAAQVLARIAGRTYFLFPLQLSYDYQIRQHSPFLTMRMACEYVLDSFARHAPADALLVIKEHPMDVGFGDWKRVLARMARKRGLDGRVLHIDGGDLETLAQQSAGMVCVNSTSGTLALNAGTPVIVLGNAIYDVPGITHQGPLDRFWERPEPVDTELYRAFRKVLHVQCLVRGGIASESAIRILVENTVPRLLDESGPPEVIGAFVHDLYDDAQPDGSSPASSR